MGSVWRNVDHAADRRRSDRIPQRPAGHPLVPGTGIAGKLDVRGAQPAYLAIENETTGAAATVAVLADGAFIAPLDPGTDRLQPAGDARSVEVLVPDGHCVDLVLDFRIPMLVLSVPGVGPPGPWPA